MHRRCSLSGPRDAEGLRDAARAGSLPVTTTGPSPCCISASFAPGWSGGFPPQSAVLGRRLDGPPGRDRSAVGSPNDRLEKIPTAKETSPSPREHVRPWTSRQGGDVVRPSSPPPIGPHRGKAGDAPTRRIQQDPVRNVGAEWSRRVTVTAVTSRLTSYSSKTTPGTPDSTREAFTESRIRPSLHRPPARTRTRSRPAGRSESPLGTGASWRSGRTPEARTIPHAFGAYRQRPRQ